MGRDRNLARALGVNFVRLTAEVVRILPRAANDLFAIPMILRDRIWGNDLDEEQMRSELFGDASWDELKMAVLDARHLALPNARRPQTRGELLALCRWLLARNGDDDLAKCFIAGWAGNMPVDAALKQHVDALWDLRSRDPDLYWNILSGTHGDAFASIVDRSIGGAVDYAEAIRALSRMALIWGAFDAQATTTRIRRSMTKPFGWLITGSGSRMKASTIAAVFRPFMETFDKVSHVYRTADTADASVDQLRTRRPEVDDIKLRTEALADAIERDEGEFAMDGAMIAAREELRGPGNELIDQLVQEKTDPDFGNRQMSEVWYGLLPLEAVGLAALRLVQMEQQLEALLHDAVVRARTGSAALPLVIPDFEAQELRSGWKRRTRALVDAQRGSILQDDDHHSVRRWRQDSDADGSLWTGAPNDDTYIDSLGAFFAEAQSACPNGGEREWAERRRTLDLLDVAFDRRFAHTRRASGQPYKGER